MSDREWQLLTTHGAELVFAKDELLFEENSAQDLSHVYRVRRGSVRLEKGQGEKRVIFGRFEAGTLFGGLGLSSSVPAQFRADSAEVSVDRMDVQFVNRVLKLDPTIAMKFYKQLALSLSARLKSLPFHTQADQVVQTFNLNPKKVLSCPLTLSMCWRC